MQGYLELLDAKAGKAEKIYYIHTHPEVNWVNVEGNAPSIQKERFWRMSRHCGRHTSSRKIPLRRNGTGAEKLMVEEKTVKSEVKKDEEALHLKTKETIEGLSDEQVLDLLRLKWIAPLCASLRAMPEAIIAGLEKGCAGTGG